MHAITELTSLSVMAAAREMRKSELLLKLRSAQTSAADETSGPVCTPQPLRNISPLERRWGLEVRCPGVPWEPMSHNTGHAWRYKGNLNVGCLARAAEEMIRRHHILSRTLKYLDGGWRFVVRNTADFRVCRLDVAGGTDTEANAAEAVCNFFVRPFELDDEGPLRVGIAEISRDDYILCFVLHHAFTDVYSNRIFSYELAAMYEFYCHNQPSCLKEVPVSFLDYMISVEEWSKLPKAEKLLSYWERYLQGVHVPGYVREDEMVTGGFKLTASHSAMVRKLTLAERVATDLFWVATHQVTLYRLLQQDDVTTLSVDIGRRQRELVGSVGQYINLLPIRSRITTDLTLRNLLRRLRCSRQESSPYYSVPYDLIADRCSFPYASSIGNINFIPHEFHPLESFGPTSTRKRPEKKIARWVIYPYVFGIYDGGGPEFHVNWLGYVCKPFTSTELASMFERVAIALITNPDCSLSALPV